MISLDKWLQNSDSYKFLPGEKRATVRKVFEMMLSDQYFSDFAGGFYPSYLGSVFSLDGLDTLLVGTVGFQSGIFELKYQLENPLTGETVATLQSDELTTDRLSDINSELVDYNGERIFAEVTSSDIFPFYCFSKGIA